MLKQLSDPILNLSRVATAIILLGGLVATAWVQFFGPGFWSFMRESLGIENLSDRLETVEVLMPAPDVVDWPHGLSFQVEQCSHDIPCLYSLVGARTEFGATCGRPTESRVELVPLFGDRRKIEARYHDSFRFVELTQRERRFEVALDIPRVQPGEYLWRAIILYPTCPGVNEPVPRATPWWPLTIAAPDTAQGDLQ